MRISDHQKKLNSFITKSYSEEDLPVITPCSDLNFSQSLPVNTFTHLLSLEIPTIRVYSGNDGTFITFPVKFKSTIEDLKNYIFSLKEFRSNYSSIDSQSSTIDSSFNSSFTSSTEYALNEYDIEIYGVIPGSPEKIFENNSIIFNILKEHPYVRLYYFITKLSFEKKDYDKFLITVYPKAKITEIGIYFYLTIKEDRFEFTLKDKHFTHNKIILINFNDIVLISKYNKVENCLLIKRKDITKDPILIRTEDYVIFDLLMSKVKHISEIRIDSRIINDADKIITNVNKELYPIKNILKLDVINSNVSEMESKLVKELFTFSENESTVNNKCNDIIKNSSFLGELEQLN